MWENIEPEVKEVNHKHKIFHLIFIFIFQKYKNKAATAKKEYLKQLAAYRAVQISHQVI